MTNDHSGAKDFFLHLGLIVSLYTSVIALVNLLFKIINIGFPQTDSYYSYYYSGSPVSMPVATLIVFFPLFLYFSHLVYKSYQEDSGKKDLKIRKWLLYITLFITGVVFAGDLVTVLYYFLDGRELTVAFLLKALTIFVVAGALFTYYIKDIREKLTTSSRKSWAIVGIVVVLISIVLGFAVLGSPRTQRIMREDQAKINDLQEIENSIRSFVQSTGVLPPSLEALYESAYVYKNPTVMVNDYTYRVLDADTYEICATFNRASATKNVRSHTYEDPWFHSEGLSCFTRNATSIGTKPIPLLNYDYPGIIQQ